MKITIKLFLALGWCGLIKFKWLTIEIFYHLFSFIRGDFTLDHIIGICHCSMKTFCNLEIWKQFLSLLLFLFVLANEWLEETVSKACSALTTWSAKNKVKLSSDKLIPLPFETKTLLIRFKFRSQYIHFDSYLPDSYKTGRI